MTNSCTYNSPIGNLEIFTKDDYIVGVIFDSKNNIPSMQCKILLDTIKQLDEYFSGKRKSFDLPLKTCGTAFQEKVWNSLKCVPYGETRTYKEIAIMVGNARASRPVGMANNKNPLPIFIPCHRINGSDGKLVGYAGGLKVKQYLLDLENKYHEKT